MNQPVFKKFEDFDGKVVNILYVITRKTKNASLNIVGLNDENGNFFRIRSSIRNKIPLGQNKIITTITGERWGQAITHILRSPQFQQIESTLDDVTTYICDNCNTTIRAINTSLADQLFQAHQTTGCLLIRKSRKPIKFIRETKTSSGVQLPTNTLYGAFQIVNRKVTLFELLNALSIEELKLLQNRITQEIKSIRRSDNTISAQETQVNTENRSKTKKGAK